MKSSAKLYDNWSIIILNIYQMEIYFQHITSTAFFKNIFEVMHWKHIFHLIMVCDLDAEHTDLNHIRDTLSCYDGQLC